MGYSGRYHAASLAAVFIALAIGILIGVGLGSDVVSGTAENLEQSLESDLDEAREQISELEADLEREGEFGRLVYPALVANRLRGAEVAIVGIGALADEVDAEIRSVLEPSGASLREVAVVRQPPDADALVATVDGRRRDREARTAALERAARRAGRLLVTGGPGFDSLRDTLFARYSGRPGDVDGVVVVREVPSDLAPRAEAEAAALEEGLIAGIDAAGATVVGVERSDAEESAVGFFEDQSTASVDNVDQLPGKVALVFSLDGAEGSFGVKETADRLLPDLLR